MWSWMRYIPNALCVLRMLLVVPVAWLLVNHQFRATLWLFAFAAATDGADGFLAKRCGWTSELGKILDPLADKILLVGVFLTLGLMELVPLWLALVAIGRDVIITAGAIAYNSLYGYPHGKPTWASKLNTLCQVIFLLLIVASNAVGRIPENAITITVIAHTAKVSRVARDIAALQIALMLKIPGRNCTAWR